LIQKFL